jgi:predicted transglutaminase-like cysteine proteinase
VGLIAFLLAFTVTQSQPTGTAREIYERIATAAAQETGLAQLREIDLSVNSLLATRSLSPPPEQDRWRSVDEILDADDRDNCKDYVVLKQDLLNRVHIPSERMMVMVRARDELHVVVKVHYDDTDLILDNLRSVMVSMNDLSPFYEIQNGAP